MKELKVTLVPNDKEFGYSFQYLLDLQRSHITLLAGDSYEPVPVEHADRSGLARQYRRLAIRVGDLDGDDAKVSSLKSLYIPKGTFVAKLRTTVKTHKPLGEMSQRNLHAAPAYSAVGLSIWVEMQILEVLNRCEWLLSGSEALVKNLVGVKVSASMRFIQADVKDFFMTGTPAELCQAIVRHIPGPRGLLVADVSKWLLENQYVSSNMVSGSLWQVRAGSGMGLRHSGPIADLALLDRIDSWIMQSSTRRAFNIVKYYRFKDDILIISDSCALPRLALLGECCRQRARPFRISFESVSNMAVEFLALRLERQGSNIVCTPKRKLFRPVLSVESAHPPHVHVRWPSAYVKTIPALCSRQADAVKFQHEFADKLGRSFAPTWLQERVRSAIGCSSRPRRCVRDVDTLWLVLPYHAGYNRHFWHRAVRNLHDDPYCRLLLSDAFSGCPPTVSLAWRMACPRLMHYVQQTLLKTWRSMEEEVGREGCALDHAVR